MCAALALLVAALPLVPRPAGAGGAVVITNYTAPGIDNPQGITTGPDGNLWATNSSGDSVSQITPSGVITTFHDGSGPHGIVTGPDGALWYAKTIAGAIGRITTTGAQTAYTASGLAFPEQIANGSDNNLWFTDSTSSLDSAAIGRITAAGVITLFTDSAITNPYGIAAGPDGALWFTNLPDASHPGSIGRIATDGTVTVFDDPAIVDPEGITAGPDGALWFTDDGANAGNGAIGRITTTGVVTEFTGPTIYGPRQITVGPDGALWFIDDSPRTSASGSIGRITTAGIISDYTDPTISNPDAITAGPDGALWFTNRGNNSIGRVTTPPVPSVTSIAPDSGPGSGGTVVSIAGSGFTDARSVSFGSTPATTFAVNADDSITATAPAGTGLTDVTVTTPGGTSAVTALDEFQWLPPPTLAVSLQGNGGGSVLSSPPGIDCGSTCSAPFATGTQLTLTATAEPGSVFAGWSGGGCTGSGVCQVTMGSSPVTVIADFGMAATQRITAGGPHSCELLRTGLAECWGANNAGQLGDGTLTTRATPVIVESDSHGNPLSGIEQIVAGGQHTCALMQADGSVRCWGLNDFGQLGNNTMSNSKLPVVVLNPNGRGPLTGVTQLAGRGGYFTCARLLSGNVDCWGSNAFGQLGDGTFKTRLLPVAVKSASGATLTGVRSLALGGYHACALLTNDAVCWGQNANGEVGDGTLVGRTHATLVQRDSSGVPLTGISQLAAGGFHTCALMITTKVECWGENTDGQLGDGTTVQRTRPVFVGGSSPLSGVLQVVAGSEHGCALLNIIGSVRCWGDNSNGQLGVNTLATHVLPVTVLGIAGAGHPLTGVTHLEAGSLHNCALVAAVNPGSVVCWGWNAWGQLGDGTHTDRKIPVLVR